MECQDIAYTEGDGVARITIDRPDVFNAFRAQTHACSMFPASRWASLNQVSSCAYWNFIPRRSAVSIALSRSSNP